VTLESLGSRLFPSFFLEEAGIFERIKKDGEKYVVKNNNCPGPVKNK
jgi:hypothetical protein